MLFSKTELKEVERSNDPYTYIVCDPRYPEFSKDIYLLDHKPIYVGKGKGRRYRDKKNPWVNHVIANIKKAGMQPYYLMIVHDSDHDAFTCEEAFIRLFGQKILGTGPLLNIAPGGELWKDKRFIFKKGIFDGTPRSEKYDPRRAWTEMSPEDRLARNRKLSVALKGKKKRAGHAERVSAGNKGKPKSAKHRMALSERRRGTRRMNDGIKNFMVKITDTDDKINTGWNFGWLRKSTT